MPAPATKKFRSGEMLFRESEPSNSVFLILKGSVAIRKRKGAGFIEIAKVFSNEMIGELSYFDRKPRSASAVAMGEVEAVEISFDALDKIYNKVPPYLKTIIMNMAERLRKADNMIRTLEKRLVNDRGSDVSADEQPSIADVLVATAKYDQDGPMSSPPPAEDDDASEA